MGRWMDEATGGASKQRVNMVVFEQCDGLTLNIDRPFQKHICQQDRCPIPSKSQ